MKLKYLVTVVTNNDACVVLKINDDVRLDLISLGYFDGDEELIRLTKGPKVICTIFKNDGSYDSWHWGYGGKSCVEPETKICGYLIQQCIEEDFKIDCERTNFKKYKC